MGENVSPVREVEPSVHIPYIIIASGGRAYDIQKLLPEAGYRGLLVVDPSQAIDHQGLNQLGIYPHREYLMSILADRLTTDSEIPEKIDIYSAHGIRESTLARANYKTLRGMAHQLALQPNTEDCLVIGRDTTQILVYEEENISQERPGNTYDAQLKAALDLEQSKFALVSTATAIKGISGPNTNLNWIKDTYRNLSLMGPQTYGLNHPLYQISSFSSVLLRIKGVENLPRECFTNLPGGLDYDHPLVQEICEWTPIMKELPWLRLSHLDRYETFTPFNQLSTEDQTAVQMVRKGTPPMLQKHITKAFSWFENLAHTRQALHDYIYKGIM